MLNLSPNQQCQSTEVKSTEGNLSIDFYGLQPTSGSKKQEKDFAQMSFTSRGQIDNTNTYKFIRAFQPRLCGDNLLDWLEVSSEGWASTDN